MHASNHPHVLDIELTSFSLFLFARVACSFSLFVCCFRYHLDNISVWIDVRGPNIPPNSTAEQDHASRMLVNPRQTLRAILSNPKLLKKNYVIPGIPMFIVLPKQ